MTTTAQEQQTLSSLLIGRWEQAGIVDGVREERAQCHFLPCFFFGARIVPRHVGAPHLQA